MKPVTETKNHKNMFIKVCGMRDEQNIKSVAALGVDFIGKIFYPKSPRYVGDKQISNAGIDVPYVGVFVDETADNICSAVADHSLSLVQLHGNEMPELILQLRERLPGTRIIKALSIRNEDDVFRWRIYEGLVDFFLFDASAAPPDNGEQRAAVPGGSGKHFNWAVLQRYEGDTPFLLSGGISLEDVPALKSFCHPKLVGYDLNSKFETAPAVKDVSKIKEFVDSFCEIPAQTNIN